MNLNFRTLHADEIECRVGTFIEGYNGQKHKCTLLMYKDARVDMNLLDEVAGPGNWMRTHDVINNNLFCTVSIFCNNQWVSKQDVGTESNTEKEKGQASDAFKRACFNWGIGRELYTCPFVIVELEDSEVKTGQGGKKQPRLSGWNVSRIEYDDNRRVSFLEIKDGRGRVRYTSGASQKAQPTVPAPKVMATVDELIEAVKKAVFSEEVANIWKNNKALQSNQEFRSLVKERGSELKAKEQGNDN